MRIFTTRISFPLFVFTSLSVIAFSQDKAVHFGGSFNAKITHQISDNPGEAESKDHFSFTVTGNIYYDLSTDFQLVSGLSFSHYQINQLDYSPIFLCDIDPSYGADPYNSYFKTNYKTSYLGIPLEALWKVTGETNHLFLHFGLEGLIKIALNESYTLVECNDGETELENGSFNEVNNFLLLAKLGIGYEFHITKKMMLFFEPNMEYTLTRFFKSSENNCPFFNIGLNTGIKF